MSQVTGILSSNRKCLHQKNTNVDYLVNSTLNACKGSKIVNNRGGGGGGGGEKERLPLVWIN